MQGMWPILRRLNARRRLCGLVAGALSLALAACGSGRAALGTASMRLAATGVPASASPSANVPAPAPPTPVAAAVAVRACTAADVKAEAQEQGATGAVGGSILFRNIGPDDCTLRAPAAGIPVVRIKDSAGGTLSVREQGLTGSTAVSALSIAPGSAAYVSFVWTNWCAPSPALPLAVALAVPGALDEIAALLAGSGPPRCDDESAPSVLSVGAFTRAAP